MTKKPKRPVLSRLTRTLVAGTVIVSGCGDEIGVPAMDAGPADVMEVRDGSGEQDARFVGLDAAPDDAAPDDAAPDDAASSVDATSGVDAPPPGLPPADSGPDGFVGI